MNMGQTLDLNAMGMRKKRLNKRAQIKGKTSRNLERHQPGTDIEKNI